MLHLILSIKIVFRPYSPEYSQMKPHSLFTTGKIVYFIILLIHSLQFDETLLKLITNFVWTKQLNFKSFLNSLRQHCL